ncbi:hypothetical protein [Pseudomonas aeruginosa]|uniref:hypothetical protein n=1 Tax=Pseudomonas aeruginosa TaxID=287 RepID=UPI001E47E8CB|nr:hypothetical protein [Pseudomonas aeruginosa]
MEKLSWRDRRISADSGSLFQTFPSSEVQVIAHHYIDALNARIVLLQALRDSLSYLAEHCDDLEQPPGPILDDLPPPLAE